MKGTIRFEYALAQLMLLFCISTGYTQEFTSTQYYSNLPAFNPGFAGIDDHTDVKTSVYQGWNNFNVTNGNFYISAFGALNSSKRALIRNNALRTSTTDGRAQSDRVLRRRHGMGGMISERNVGSYKSFAVTFSYAYHIPLSNKFNLSFGANAGYFNQRIDFSGFTVRDEINDLFYQQMVRAGYGNQQSIVMNFGTVLYSNRFYLGLSSNDLIVNKLSSSMDFTETTQYQLQTAGLIKLSQDLSLNSGLRVIYKNGYNLGWSINSRLRYKELIYLGSSFGYNSQLSMLFGLNLNSKFNINYAYDQYLGSKDNFNLNSQEIMLGFSFSNKSQAQTKFW